MQAFIQYLLWNLSFTLSMSWLHPALLNNQLVKKRNKVKELPLGNL